MNPRVLILIVSYDAEQFIHKVLARIPAAIWNSERFDLEVLIIDDQSKDQTFDRAVDYVREHGRTNITILYNPRNQGYGGNQKIGYHYAVDKGFDHVVMLHGDGQYAPEHLGAMIDPLLDNKADVVLGSRMINRAAALRGKMPLYKWVGNQILTFWQNRILGSNLAEFHTGYRAYRVSALASIPFDRNSDDFDFDTDILIQLIDTGKHFVEIPIPTFYGQEISRVNGLKYAGLIVRTSLLSRVMRLGIFYNPKFDYEIAKTRYAPKLGYPSSHQFALDYVRPGVTVFDIGGAPGCMARELREKQVKTIALDRAADASTREHAVKVIDSDVETYDFSDQTKVDTVLLLDVVEHLMSPEQFMRRLRQRYSGDGPDIVITTANVAFLPVRLALLFGQFNYNRRGILDLTHTRLFTFSSLRRMLMQNGYEVVSVKGLPAPYPLAFGEGFMARTLLRLNSLAINLSKGLFSYQIAMVVRLKPTLNVLLRHAQQTGAKKLADHQGQIPTPTPTPTATPTSKVDHRMQPVQRHWHRRFTRVVLMVMVTGLALIATPEWKTPVDAAEKAVAVTIDDLPAPGGALIQNTIAGLRENTEKLLAACRKAGVPVIGFVNEAKLVVNGETEVDRASREAVLKLWTDNGFELGNHTFTHGSLNQKTLDAFKKDVIDGEPVTRRLMEGKGGTLRYFRHPFLHVGTTLDVRRASEAFLAERGYIIAPVTVDAKDYIYASVYATAVRKGDKEMAAKLAADYLRFSDEKFAFAEQAATRLMGRDIHHILLLHANAINADHFGALADVIKKRGYRFITLEEALKDEAYKQPDTYVGTWGHTWLRHWELTAGKTSSESSDPPDWVMKIYGAR